MTQLLPGLPDDVARHCLLHLPYNAFPSATSVNHHWNQQLHSPLFHRLRNAAKMASTVLVFAQAQPPSPPSCTTSAENGKPSSPPSYHLSLFELTTGRWSRVPAIPGAPAGRLPIFCRLAAVGRQLVVVGGWDPDTWAASNCVYVFDFLTDAWRSGARMPGPRRSFFACAAASDAGLVFVAGGHDEEKNALRSAAVYDVARDEWTPVADMASERDECAGVYRGGAFHVIGGYATDAQGRFYTSAEAFDLPTWQWGPVVDGALESGMCLRSCPVSQLYTCRSGGQVVVFGTTVDGGHLAGYAAEIDGKGHVGMWQKVAVPEEYSGHIQASCSLTI